MSFSQNNLWELLEQRQVIFFVGSGVSWGCLPTSSELLKLGAGVYLPADQQENIGRISRIQPEIFYQELSYFIGEKAISSFDVLDSPTARPLLAHYLIVWLASKASLPVITTNFDRLLEKAAEDLHLSPNIVGPQGPFSINKQFEIWKVHGTVGQKLFALMPQITQPNFKLLAALESLYQENNVCFVGYSGRDVDLFPLIKSFKNRRQPFWIDPCPAKDVEKRIESIRANHLKTTLDELVQKRRPEVIAKLLAAGMPEAHENNMMQNRKNVTEIIENERKRLNSEKHLKEIEKNLFLAICFARTGKFEAAFKFLSPREKEMTENAGPELAARVALTLALLADFLSDYRASEQYAVKARDILYRVPFHSTKTHSLEVQALHAIAMARKMQLCAKFRSSNAKINFTPNLILAAGRYFLHFYFMLKIRRLLNHIDHRRGFGFWGLRVPSIDSSAWQLWAWNRFLDHKTILYSYLTAFKRIPIFSTICVRGLRHILSDAEKIGDASLIANTRKQLQELGESTKNTIEFSSDIYEIIGDNLNLALVHRNLANKLIENGNPTEAAKEFCKMLRYSVKCGSKANVLKAYVGLFVCGKTPRIQIVKKRLKGLTGSGYEKFVSIFLNLLETTS